MWKKSFAIVLLVLVWVVRAYGLGVEVAAGAWYQEPKGDLSYKGDKLDLVDEMGFEEEFRGEARAKVDLPFINFYLGYAQVEFEGTGEKSTNFFFGNTPFLANTQFSSLVSLDQYDLGIYFGVPLLGLATKLATLGFAGINIDFGVVLRTIKGEASISQGTREESKSFTGYVPLGYLGLGVAVWKLKFEAEGMGISYGDNKYYDLVGRVRLNLLKPIPLGPALFVAAGYRYQKLEFDIDDVEGSFELAGPFLEVGGAL